MPFQLESARIEVTRPMGSSSPMIATSVVSLKSEMKLPTIDGIENLERLRHDDEAHGLPVVETERVGALVLAARQGREAAADGLGHVGGREQRHHDDDAQDDVEVGARRQEDVEQEGRDQQQGDQRHAADELDEADADAP